MFEASAREQVPPCFMDREGEHARLVVEGSLDAVSVVRNLGNPLAQFTTVNCDFLQHYRPKMNVVDRPHAGAGGKGYSLTGHHEIMIPLLAATLIECEP